MAGKYGIWFKGAFWREGPIKNELKISWRGWRRPHFIDRPLTETRQELQQYIDDPEDELSSGDYEVREYS